MSVPGRFCGISFLFFAVLLSYAKSSVDRGIPIDSFEARRSRIQEFLIFANAKCPLPFPGLLEAVLWSRTRMRPLGVEDTFSAHGLPPSWTIAGLVSDGKGFFLSNLDSVSKWTQIPRDSILNSSAHAILATSCALANLVQFSLENHPSPYRAVVYALERFSEIPASTAGLQFARASQVYEVIYYLTDSVWATVLGLPAPLHRDSFLKWMPDSLVPYLQAPVVVLNCTPPEYPGALWVPADPSNYTSPRPAPVSAVTIHTIQGRYSSAIAWFQNPSANVSAHYVIRSFDGQITQMVCENDEAWHVGIHNDYTIGIEHEGFVSDPTWYTVAMYQSSAKLVRHICQSYNISPLRTAWWPWVDTVRYDLDGVPGVCTRIKGHQHYSNQTHYDPWKNWNWHYYYNLINGPPPVDTLVADAQPQTFYDPGGPAGNYPDDTRQGYLILGSPDSSLVLILEMVALEPNWDYLLLFHSGEVPPPDVYPDRFLTGTFSAETLIITSGSAFLEFRSDCAVSDSGWRITYFSVPWTSPLVQECPPPRDVRVVDSSFSFLTLQWSSPEPEGHAYPYRIRWWHPEQVSPHWTYTTDTILTITGLAGNHLYRIQVQTVCPDTVSQPFTLQRATLEPRTKTSDTLQICRGYLRDSGGQPGGYRNDEQWSLWLLSPSPSSSLMIRLDSFQVEDGFDFLRIRNSGGQTLYTLTGSLTTLPALYPGLPSTVELNFSSDFSVTDPGWVLAWEACEGEFPLDFPSDSFWLSSPLDTLSVFPMVSTPDGFQALAHLALTLDTSTVPPYWVASPSSGEFQDLFEIPGYTLANWTFQAGNWTFSPDPVQPASQTLHQTDEAHQNTSASLILPQVPTQAYLYHWKGWMEGSGTNRRAGLHIFASDLSASNRGNSFLIYFRVDHDRVQIYTSVNNTLSLVVNRPYPIDSMRWYDFKVLLIPWIPEILVFIDDILVARWKGTDPVGWIAQGVSLRSGGCQYRVDSFRVYRVFFSPYVPLRCSVSAVSPDSARCRTVLLALSRTLEWNSPATFPVYADFSPPAPPAYVRDGNQPPIDVDTFWNASLLSFFWRSAQDSQSGILGYEYAIVQNPADTGLISSWMFTPDTIVQVPGAYSPGVKYYAVVRAVNRAGLRSSLQISDGQLLVSSSVQLILENTPACTRAPLCGTFQVSSGDSVKVLSSSLPVLSFTGERICVQVPDTFPSDTFWLFWTLSLQVWRNGSPQDTVNLTVQVPGIRAPAPPELLSGPSTVWLMPDSPHALRIYRIISGTGFPARWFLSSGGTVTSPDTGHQIAVRWLSEGTHQLCGWLEASPTCTSDTLCREIQVIRLPAELPSVKILEGGPQQSPVIAMYSLIQDAFTFRIVNIEGREVFQAHVPVSPGRTLWQIPLLLSPGWYILQWHTLHSPALRSVPFRVGN